MQKRVKGLFYGYLILAQKVNNVSMSRWGLLGAYKQSDNSKLIDTKYVDLNERESLTCKVCHLIFRSL